MSQTEPSVPAVEAPAPMPGESGLASAEAELRSLKDSLAASERRRALDRALLEAGAIDVESAAIIAAAASEPASTDPAKLVAGLKRRKPFLFHAAAAPTAAPVAPDPTPLDSAAVCARATGDRRSLLHYLRLRRGSP